MRNGINHTVSPVLAAPRCELTRQRLLTARRKAGKTSARPRKIWKTWGKAESLSSLERKKRAVLNSSAEPIPCLRKAFMTD